MNFSDKICFAVSVEQGTPVLSNVILVSDCVFPRTTQNTDLKLFPQCFQFFLCVVVVLFEKFVCLQEENI